MSTYQIVRASEFLPQHIESVEKFKLAINLLSQHTSEIIGLKDVDSNHMASSNCYAKIVGLKSANDVIGRSDFDMPCDGTSQYAAQYVQEDLELITSQKTDSVVSFLNVHNYSDGLKARIFKKKIFFHQETHSILGTVYSGHDIELKNFVNIIPNYIIQFGALGSMEVSSSKHNNNDLQLNNYEQEICFLLLLNWDFKQIAEFMNTFRPDIVSRTADTIIKKRNYICQKLHIKSNSTKDLCEYLVSVGFHNKMPVSLYSRIIGSKRLGEESIAF